MFNITALAARITKFTNKTKFLIAYSGGMDSHVLLHTMHEIRATNPLIIIRAIHIHHGLSENADSWLTHCAKICSALDINLTVKFVTIPFTKKNHKHNVEALAREARYEEFAKTITEDEVLLTAHHLDDQAETVLLQLFRGCGPKGLSAMPIHKGLAQGSLLRPLLEFSRKELFKYAQQNQLSWIEDESNEHIGYDRNFIRHQLMPVISQRWSNILKTLVRSAKHCASTIEVLDTFVHKDYLYVKGINNDTLSISKILTFDLPRQNSVIRYWLQKLKLPMPSSIKLQHIITDVLHCRHDAQPIVHWQNVEIRRYRDDLYAINSFKIPPVNLILPWDISANLELPHNLGMLTLELLKSHHISNYAKNITVRFRYPGAKYKVKGRSGTHSLTKLFQEKGIPPWQRNYTPLIFQGEELIDIVSI